MKPVIKDFDYEVENLYGSTDTYWVSMEKLGGRWHVTIDNRETHTAYQPEGFATLKEAREWGISYCRWNTANGDEIRADQLKGKVVR